MATPNVSFVTTLYNKAPFLPYVVEGLRRQTGEFGREFIFIDDGSTDDSVAVLRRLVDDLPNVTVVEQRNQGPGPATNAGLDRASGDFIKLVDGDDVLLPWATQALLDAIEMTGCHAAYAPSLIAGTYSVAASADTSFIAARRREVQAVAERRHGTLALFLASSQTNPTGILVSSESVRASGGCDPAIFVQDYYLNLQLAALGDFAEVREELFLMPEDLSGRVSDNSAQIEHDGNLAIARFVHTHPELPVALKRDALIHATRLAVRWAERARGESRYRMKHFWIYRAVRLGLLRPTNERIHAVCRIYDGFPGIRHLR